MNFNIALNTIVYILIFIFPGVLFRKFYYRGDFTKQFSQGNLFERFIITLFLSVISLLSCVGIILVFREVFHLNFLTSISYDTIKTVFDTLLHNTLPDKKTVFSVYKDFTILLLLIYFLSSVLGAISHTIIVIFKIDVKSNIFRFNDKWHYHIKGKTYETLKDKKYLYTFANVLTEVDENKIMYSGYLKDYCIDENNNLTSIFLTEAHRYDYKNLANHDENREKQILGNMIWISGLKILNVNFTHIVEEKKTKDFKKIILNFISILFYFICAFTFTIFWFENFFISFETFLKKTIFILFCIFIEISIYDLLKKFLSSEEKNVNENITYILICIVPLLWSLGLYSGKWIFFIYIISLVLLILYAIFFVKSNEHLTNREEIDRLQSEIDIKTQELEKLKNKNNEV